ncbi:MAG: chromosome partitioning protein ParB [Corynebacterium sp.]|nr:chromosome partitioning protein ParB [Corynebacterium sp.]
MGVYMKMRNSLASVLTGALVMTSAMTVTAYGAELDPNIKGSLVLAETMYFDAATDQIRLDEGRIDYDRVTEFEVEQVRLGLESLSDEQIDEVLLDNGYDPAEIRQSNQSEFSVRAAPVVIWGGAAIIGILTGGGLIFYSQYSSNEEKRNLIDKCHEQGGSPVIDTRDSAGLEGSTDSISAKREGGYRFECQKS